MLPLNVGRCASWLLNVAGCIRQKARSNACGALLPHVSERDKLREAFGAGREAANKDARRIVKEGRVAIRERCLPLPTCGPGWDVSLPTSAPGLSSPPAHIRDEPGPSPRARQKSARRSAVGLTASRPLRCSESLAGPSVAKETRQFRHLAPTTKAAGTGKLKARGGCCQRESKSQSVVWGVSRAQGRYALGMADGERASGIGVLVH
jgi:hypothetical protein